MRVLVLAALLTGCGSKLNRLENYELDHYEGLRVWMTDKQEKQYLRGKTPEERDQWLKDLGFWDQWYQYDQGTRDQILAGDVQVGWTYDQVFMSWGEPHQKKRLAGRRATRSYLCVYRFEVNKDGAVMVWAPGSKASYSAIEKYTLELYIDDEMVTEVKRLEGWP